MKLRPFELALVIVFIFLAIVALVMLSNYKADPKVAEGDIAPVGVVTIWGTVPNKVMTAVLKELKDSSDSYRDVNYRYLSDEEFDATLLNALADNIGPDLVLISQERLVELRRRIQPISYDSFPIRDIKNLYVDGAHIFAMSDGLYGYPIAVDPFMMYWNRDILATEGFLEPPKTWESLVNTMFSVLIKRDFDRTINRSVVAMGEYGNVRNAFGTLSALFIQGGSERVVEDKDGQYVVKLQTANSGEGNPLRTAADFYTRFSKPSNALYSWNRAFEDDRKQFASEDLALYFGYGSEGPEIEKLNPNLNFDIAEIPQGANATTRRTYGRFYAFSMMKSSANKTGASVIMLKLGSAEISAKIAAGLNMVPPYRSLVSQGSNDSYGRINYQSASIALGWLNPDMDATDGILQTMTQDINENRRDLTSAVADAVSRLSKEY